MIVLPDDDHAEAKRKAAREGISMSEYIRRLVARDLDGGSAAEDPSVIFGLFDSGGSRIAGIPGYWRDLGLFVCAEHQ